MLVSTVHKQWLEDQRDREWVDLEEAVNRVNEEKLKRIISKVPEHLTSYTEQLSRA